MKRKRNYLIIFLLVMLMGSFVGTNIAVGQDKLPDPFVLLPQPRQVELLAGKGLLSDQLKGITYIEGINRPVLGTFLSQLPFSESAEPGLLKLKIEKGDDIPESHEGYMLTISDGEVVISARSEAGLFYGCQTLEQLLEDSRQYEIAVPACRITDYPDLNYRAVQIDVKHHLDHMRVYYEAIDRLARYKINAVIFEFEDKLRYRRQPLIGAPQAISIDEMAALTRYASDRNIEITPLVQGLGHATFILKHQEYAHLRELEDNRWAFCPLHEGTYQVLFDMYRDAFDATPGSRYLHIGGDEIGNIGLCPRCNPTAEEKGTLSLNLYWLNRVSEFATDHGRIPIFWDDMPLKEAGVYETAHDASITEEEVEEIWKRGEDELTEVISELPDSVVFMRWNYSTGKQPGNLKTLEYYHENDIPVMIATAAQSGPAALFPFDDRDGTIDDRGIRAIKSFIELSAERGIDGMLCTAWDDRSPHMETHWRGLIASAQYSWHPGSLSLDAYDNAYLQKEYGTTMENYGDVYIWLRESAEFWEKAFNRQSDRLDIHNALLPLPGIAHFLSPEESEEIRSDRTDYTQKLITLPEPEQPGEWSEKYADRIETAERILKEYPGIDEKLKELYLTSRRNQYHWEVFRALNDFQITAPRLMVALNQADVRSASKRERGIGEVRNALEEFETAWAHLKEVYSKSRFYAYPPDYVPDRYFHFASMQEDLSYLIMVEELLHEMVRDWMEEL